MITSQQTEAYIALLSEFINANPKAVYEINEHLCTSGTKLAKEYRKLVSSKIATEKDSSIFNIVYGDE